jgi:acyl carrier protein
MGLDSVELVMEFEDEFEITIPDADAEQMVVDRSTFTDETHFVRDLNVN